MPANASKSPVFCPGCMSEMPQPPRCLNSACRWDDSRQPDIQEHLPRHYLLLDRYYIGRVLGQGGFGITYLARDLELDRQIAIKEYLPREHCSRLTDRVTVRSHGGDKAKFFSNGLHGFLNEAKNIARLDGHPNIVSITDHIKANGTAYMVMQFIPGRTLKQFLADQGGRIPYTTARDIMLHVIAGLRKAHQHGVMHRDISPDNIMISTTGPVKIIDFGAARQASGDIGSGLTVILKPGYAPEEQYRARGKQGPWTDVYAVAATLYRCITGEAPPDAPDRLAEDELVPPSAFCPDLPPAVEAAILKGLALKAVDRYQTMDEFQDDLLAAGMKQQQQPEALKPKFRPEEKSGEKPPLKEPERPKSLDPAQAKEKKTPMPPKTTNPSGTSGGTFGYATAGTSGGTSPKPWFLSPVTFAVFAALLLAAIGLAFYLHTPASPAASAPSTPPPEPTPPPTGTSASPAPVRDWANLGYDDPALANCGNVQPCLDRKTRADSLAAVGNWKAVPIGSPLFSDCMGFAACLERNRHRSQLLAVANWSQVPESDPKLADCMGFAPCLQRARASSGSSISDEALGNYTFCKDSPNPARCFAYKKSEGILDGSSR